MNCRLCKKTDLVLYYSQGKRHQYKYYKCNNCGLVNLDISSQDIYKNQHKYIAKYTDPFDKKRNRGSIQTYSFIKKRIKQVGNMLDVGCGNGSLLNYAKKDGWKVKGIEISTDLAKKVNKTLGIEIMNKNFIDIEKMDKLYDLVTLRHVLEHIPDSLVAMNKIHTFLKNKGYAVMEFPNIEGFSFKYKRFLTKKNLYKKEYKEDYYPGHCNEFSRKSFQYLATVCGFKLLHWETYSYTTYGQYFNKLTKAGTKARALIQKS